MTFDENVSISGNFSVGGNAYFTHDLTVGGTLKANAFHYKEGNEDRTTTIAEIVTKIKEVVAKYNELKRKVDNIETVITNIENTYATSSQLSTLQDYVANLPNSLIEDNTFKNNIVGYIHEEMPTIDLSGYITEESLEATVLDSINDGAIGEAIATSLHDHPTMTFLQEHYVEKGSNEAEIHELLDVMQQMVITDSIEDDGTGTILHVGNFLTKLNNIGVPHNNDTGDFVKGVSDFNNALSHIENLRQWVSHASEKLNDGNIPGFDPEDQDYVPIYDPTNIPEDQPL